MDSKNTKPGVALARINRARAIHASLLFDKLAARIGAHHATRLLSHALERSGRDEVPEHPDDLLDFASTHLVGELGRVLGPGGVDEFLSELADAARLSSGVRSSMRCEAQTRGIIALVDQDIFRRTSTAKQLIGRQLKVISLRELDELVAEPSRPDVLVVDVEGATSTAFLRVLCLPDFEPAVVVHGDEARGRGALEHAGVVVYELVARAAPAALIAAVERALERRGSGSSGA